MKNLNNIYPLYLIKLNNISDFSFDIFCRLNSTSCSDCNTNFSKNVENSQIERFKKYGALNPIWTCGNTLIAGFETFATARAAAFVQIPAFVLPDNTTKEAQLDLMLELIGAKKQLPLMPMARLVNLTEKTVDNPIKWLRERFNQHFWSITIDIFCRLKSLAASPINIQSYFQKYDAPLNTAMSILNLNPDFQNVIIDFANEKRVRPIELEKIISDITDCAKVEKTFPEEIWNEIFDNEKNALKKNLIERKNPFLTKLREKFSSKILKFEKNTGMQISYDNDFENPNLEFKFLCKSKNECKMILENALKNLNIIWND